MIQKDTTKKDWFQCLQEIIQLLTKQVQFRDHLTDALRLICKILDADTAIFIETIPTGENSGEFVFHRILKVPVIGSQIEYDTPEELVTKKFSISNSMQWLNKLEKSASNHSNTRQNKNTTKVFSDRLLVEKIRENSASAILLDAIDVDFSSFLAFPLQQEEAIYGYLSFSSSESMLKSEDAITFSKSCVQIITNLLASQQLSSLLLVKRDFLKQSLIDDVDLKTNHEAIIPSSLQKQSKLASHIASTIPDFIFLVDIEKGKAVFANTDVFLGYDINIEKDPLEIFASIIHPDDQSIAIMEFILKLKDAKDGEVISSDYRMRHKNGQWVWISERAKVFKRFDDGVVKQYLTVMQDVTAKKKALIQISESEQRYRNLVKYSTEGIFYTNCGKPISTKLSPEEQTEQYYQTAFIQECNLALAQMYEYDNEVKLEGQKVKDIHSRASYQLNKQSFLDFVVNDYHVEDTETVEMLDSGSIRYFLNRRLGIIEKGHLIGIWGVQRDITAKREAEMALQESEVRLSGLVRDTKLGLWEWSVEKKTFFLNDICLELLGLKENTISLLSFLRLTHPEDFQQIATQINKQTQNLRLDTRFLDKNGEWRWIQIHGSKVEMPNGSKDQRYSGTAIDIDKQKTAELLIKESAALLKAILNTLPDTKLRINYEGKILAIYASSNNQNHSEIDLNDEQKKDLEDILPPFVAKGLLFNARKALDTQELQTFEFVEAEGKGLQYFEARINSISYEEAIIILRNITPLKIAEKALNDQINKYDREKRQLEKYIESNLQLENFAYIASHDLREPLRTMRTFGQFLNQRIGNDLDKDSRSYLDFIINSANRMNQLIEDLLTYSRVDTDPLTREAIDTEKLLSFIKESLRSRIDETDAKIIVRHIPKTIYGSPVRIEQVFQNIISNAIKFHQKGTRPIITIRSKETHNHWRFSIQDNGIGIKAEFFDKIFAIFKKLHNHQVYQGTGIGLALVKRIISQHGGEVWLESTEGVGTTFYFTLLK